MPLGLMIASPRSGSGKTTVTLGLLRVLARRGLSMGAFKCGPDYIDPAFHTVATGRASFNLDSWTMPEILLESIFSQGIEGTDMVIAEGSMGLFDGVAQAGASGNGASADIAARFGLPVILVIDVSGQSQSAGAVAMGFKHFQPDVQIAGVILSNVASERHRVLAMRGIERTGIPVFGALPRNDVPAIPERHLGLVQAGELPDILPMMDKLADTMETHLDMDGIMKAAKLVKRPETAPLPAFNMPFKSIALASDIAFSFTYPHVLAQWRAKGIKIIPFSPLANEVPNPEADLCWLPGGYPELHAEKLSNNRQFIEGLRKFAQKKPVHGECGGYMVLGETILDAQGKEWPMVGLLPLVTSFAKRKLHLGYRAVRLSTDSPIGQKGDLVRGHEFHYASIIRQDNSQSLGEASDANGVSLGPAGQRQGYVTGSFFHAVACDNTII